MVDTLREQLRRMEKERSHYPLAHPIEEHLTDVLNLFLQALKQVEPLGDEEIYYAEYPDLKRERDGRPFPTVDNEDYRAARSVAKEDRRYLIEEMEKVME